MSFYRVILFYPRPGHKNHANSRPYGDFAKPIPPTERGYSGDARHRTLRRPPWRSSVPAARQRSGHALQVRKRAFARLRPLRLHDQIHTISGNRLMLLCCATRVVRRELQGSSDRRGHTAGATRGQIRIWSAVPPRRPLTRAFRITAKPLPWTRAIRPAKWPGQQGGRHVFDIDPKHHQPQEFP